MRVDAKYVSQVYPSGVYGLDDFSLHIDSGDFVAVVGPSGCGKTTLLRVLAGLEKISCGELYVNGLLAENIPLIERKIAYVFQEYALYPNYTVWEIVQTALQRYKLSPEAENKRIKQALIAFGLADVAGALPRQLSGGQQQRVALAKAVVTTPDLILFDEPLSNVAPKQRAEYMQYLKLLKEQLPNATFVYATHNSSEAFTLANKLLVMSNGKVLQYGNTQHVMAYPYHLDVLQSLSPTETYRVELMDGIAKLDDIVVQVDAPNQQVELAFNRLTDKWCVFDTDGNSLVGQPQYLKIPALYQNKKLTVGEQTLPTDEHFSARYLGTEQCNLVVATDLLSDHDDGACVSLPITHLADNIFDICGTKVLLKQINTSATKVYFHMEDLSLWTNSRKLAHYKVYNSACVGKVLWGKIHLPCGSFPYNGKNGRVVVTIKGGAHATLQKGGLKFSTLCEDDFGSHRLAYVRLKGFDNYVTLNIGKNKSMSNKKHKLQIDSKDISIRYIH